MAASDPKATPPIEQLLAAMEKWNASDLFICAGKVPAVRLHGAVVALEVAATPQADVERFLSLVLSDEQRHRLQTHGDVSLGHTLDNGTRFRLNVARQLSVPSLFARAVPKAARPLEDLGLPAALGAFTENAQGLVLVAGAGGSGRTTALAALVHHINGRRAAHIVTIEDPVELLHMDVRARVTQREVGSDAPSYAIALQQASREGADVIVIGELDTPEVVRAALSAALRGQLVLAGVAASDCTRALKQLVTSLPDADRQSVAHDLALALIGVAGLRLLPRADGQGRVVAAELLSATPALGQALRDQAWRELHEHAQQEAAPGVVTQDAALEALCRRGAIAPEVAVAYASNAEALTRRLRSADDGHAELANLVTVDIQSLLRIILKRNASDLHLSVGQPPILRIHGNLQAESIPALTRADVENVVHSLMSARQREIYATEKELDFALSLPDGRRFRANAYHERGQPAVAFRTITADIPDATALGLPPAVLRMGEEPHGLLLVVGPTGAGKTTTLACLVDRINHTRPCHIITVEDPIEYVHKSDCATIHQREVGSDTQSFAAALKYILRQDPDVVLIGELRDLETVAAALTAAETGHLVLATLHTNDAVQTIDRIIDVFPPHQQAQTRSQLAAALIGVVSQRLLPRADGQGRLAAFEVMVATHAIRTLVREAKMHQALGVIQTGRSVGMVTMDQSLEELLRRGAIDKEEALRYMQNPATLDKPRPKPTAA
jgi:twitching motility protein PilT